MGTEALILALLPILTPFLTELLKRIAPGTPKILVVCAPAVLGALAETARAAFSDSSASPFAGAAAGASGNAVYAAFKTVKAGDAGRAVGVLCALGLSVALLFGTGCASTTPQQRIALGSLIAGNAAKIGAAYDLGVNPGHRGAYVAGVLALDALLKNGDYTAAKLQAALQQLPIKEFQGDSGTLIVSATVLAYDIASQLYFDPQSAPAVQAFAQAIRDGLQAALDAPPRAKSASPVPKSLPPPAPEKL